MAKKNQHVVHTEAGWGVRGEHNTKLTRIVPTKQEAIKVATTIAQNTGSEVVIHGRDGKIQNSNSHGNDPCPPKDTVH